MNFIINKYAIKNKQTQHENKVYLNHRQLNIWLHQQQLQIQF